MTRTPLDTWDDSLREELTHAVLAHGWSRQFPGVGALLLVDIMLSGRAVRIDDISRVNGSPSNPEGDWNGPCWDDFEPLTAESLAELNAAYDEPVDERGVDEVNAEDLAHHQDKIATVDGYAKYFGLPPVRTCRDMLDLIIATGVVVRGADGLLRPMYPLPLPEDLLPVSAEERALLHQMREEDAVEQAERAAAE